MGLLGKRGWRRRRAAPEIRALPWQASDGSLRRRGYASYEQYLAHQVAKLDQIELSAYDAVYREALRERLRAAGVPRRGESVLCLGARIGTECKAFLDLGAFALGVDLNPGPDNRFVVTGDFHALQFADASVDWVFTNALDHAFDLPRVLAEVRRVLKPAGGLIAEIVAGSRDPRGREAADYESLWWDHADDVIALLERRGFAVTRRVAFEVPWRGDAIVCRQTGRG